GGDAGVEQRGIRLDVVEQKSCELRKLAEASDLLLDDRRGGAYGLRRPVASSLAEIRHQPRRVLVRRERAQVDAVQPVELRVVEGRGARPDALEREALHEL